MIIKNGEAKFPCCSSGGKKGFGLNVVIITVVHVFFVFFAFHSALFKESENELQVDRCKINPHCNVV